MTDHQATAYLRKHNALVNYHRVGNANIWTSPATGEGKSGMPARGVLVCFYSVQKGKLKIEQWVPEELIEPYMARWKVGA